MEKEKKKKRERKKRGKWNGDDAKLEDFFLLRFPLCSASETNTTLASWMAFVYYFFSLVFTTWNSPHFFHQQKTSPSTHKHISHGSFRWICNAIHRGQQRTAAANERERPSERKMEIIFAKIEIETKKENTKRISKWAHDFHKHSFRRWNKRNVLLVTRISFTLLRDTRRDEKKKCWEKISKPYVPCRRARSVDLHSQYNERHRQSPSPIVRRR